MDLKLDSNYAEFIKTTYKEMIPIKAISPESGGTGEYEKAKYIEGVLSEMGIKAKWYNVKDSHGVTRPNLIATYGPSNKKTFWIVAHTDVVPEGDISLWKTKPFEAVIKGDYVYGRGTEDDGQGIMLALGVAKHLTEAKAEPRFRLGLAFVADEEVGSVYGAQYLVNKEIFSKRDFALVPDAGNSDGSMIEIAEKHVLWLRFEVIGKQSHGSTPEKGINANRLGMLFYSELYDMLHRRFNGKDMLFEPPVSTFEPTKKEQNVPNINTIPGTDVQYFDCRILPRYRVDAVLSLVRKTAADFSRLHGCKINISIVSREDAPKPTSGAFVEEFLEAVKAAKNVEPKLMGVGGGTVAKYFRKIGMPSIVWMTIDETAHSPNEYAKISNIISDTRVVLKFL
jgi:succinyl-diaminopimelate desuccinylase